MKILLLAIAAVAALPSVSFPSITVQNTWSEHGTTYAVVQYKNESSKTFNSLVTIRCNTVAGDGSIINTNTRSFFNFEHGPIKPGFTGIVKVPINDAGNKKAVKVTCSVNEQ